MQNLNTIDTNRITPFTVGFEELFDKLYGLETNSVGFPPYNIIKIGEYNYQIEMALAGYNKKDIEIEIIEGELSISSKKNEPFLKESEIVHKGIATKNFTRKFTLSDEIQVKSADFSEGMLTIKLERIIPEHKNQKKFKLNNNLK